MKTFFAVLALALVASAMSVPLENQQWRKVKRSEISPLKSRNMNAIPGSMLTKKRREPMTPIHYKPGRQGDICSQEGGRTAGKIVGGEESVPNQFPWLAFVHCDSGGWSCTGSVISDTAILTAGHCVYGCTDFSITIGEYSLSTDGDEVAVIEVNDVSDLEHPDYNPTFALNDVGVVPLPSPIDIDNERVMLSCLPEPRQDGEDIDYLAGQLTTVTGWGKTSDLSNQVSDIPMFARDRPIITNQECKDIYTVSVNDNTICIDTTGGIGVCNGDSGGPLNLQTETDGQYIQVGVASYVASAGCASGLPHGFARVSEMLDFIAPMANLN